MRLYSSHLNFRQCCKLFRHRSCSTWILSPISCLCLTKNPAAISISHFFRAQSVVFMLFFVTKMALADPNPSPYMADNYWCCTISDSTHKTWSEYSTYKLAAIAKVSDDCKKQSKDPLSCIILQNSCEHFIHGVSTRPLWRCLALDNRAARWPSNLENDQEAAISNAEAQCKNNSPVPETCYVNQITCRNLNPVAE